MGRRLRPDLGPKARRAWDESFVKLSRSRLPGKFPAMQSMSLMRLVALIAALLALAVPPASAETGVEEGSILLGHSGPLSGPLADLNREYLSGAELYFGELNRRGGIHGRTIELTLMDDAYDPDTAARNVTELIDRYGVFALFACFGTGPGAKTIPIAESRGVPFFAPYSGADMLRAPIRPGVFHLRASYGEEIEKIVDHLTSLGVTRIAVVHHADPFGEAGKQAAITSLGARNLDAAALIPILSSGANADEVIAKVRETNPAAIILVTAGRSTGAFARALLDTELQPMVYGLSVIGSKQLIEELGARAHGIVVAQTVPSPFRPAYGFVRDYVQLARAYGSKPSYTALEGYLAAQVFTEALNRAGRNLTRERLTQAFNTMGGHDLGGMKLQFSSQRHVGLDFVDLAIIRHGSFTR